MKIRKRQDNAVDLTNTSTDDDDLSDPNPSATWAGCPPPGCSQTYVSFRH